MFLWKWQSSIYKEQQIIKFVLLQEVILGMVYSSKEGCNIIMTDGAISVHVEMFEHVHGGLMGVQVIVLPLVDELVTHDATTPIVIKVGDEFFLKLCKGKESVVVEVPQGPEFIGQLPNQQLTPVGVSTMWTVALNSYKAGNRQEKEAFHGL